MIEIPEDILHKFMELSGLPEQQARKELTKSIREMTHGPIFESQMPTKKGKRGPKPKFDKEHYPHYLPAVKIWKYTVRVTLKGISPAIWRKFECPSNISLRHLTELILLLMGWENEHLNQIRCSHGTYYVPCYQYSPDGDWGDTYFQEEFKLSDILCEKGKSIRWEYDFGDGWQHEIRLSSIEEYQEGEPHDIVFKSGKGACPPEDCGGIWGYEELLELNEKRKFHKRISSEEKSHLEWYGISEDFDPEYLDKNECAVICEFFSRNKSEDKHAKADATSQSDNSIQKAAKKLLKKITPVYSDILTLAFRIREYELWEDLDDSDVYAIRIQDGSEMYVATMGYGGESYAIQLYDGQESFQAYIAVAESVDLPLFEHLDNHNWANYMTIMYQEPEDGFMLPEHYAFIEEWAKVHKAVINPDYGYPFLQHFRPHLWQSFMLDDEQGLSRVKEALEAIAWFGKQIVNSEDLTEFGFKDYREYATAKGGKTVPLIVQTSDGYKVERTKLPGRIGNCVEVGLPEPELQHLRLLKKNGTKYCRLIHYPQFVRNEENEENAYKPLIILSIDKNSEMLERAELICISENIELDVLRAFKTKVEKDGSLPQRIITDDPRTEAIFKSFCKYLGIILEFKRTRIPLLAAACELLYDDFQEK